MHTGLQALFLFFLSRFLAPQGSLFYVGSVPGFVEKGLRPLQPVCSGAFPPASPPCHHYGQGCRSFLPKICAPRFIIPSRAVFMSARSELESERYKKPVQHGKPTP